MSTAVAIRQLNLASKKIKFAKPNLQEYWISLKEILQAACPFYVYMTPLIEERYYGRS